MRSSQTLDPRPQCAYSSAVLCLLHSVHHHFFNIHKQALQLHAAVQSLHTAPNLLITSNPPHLPSVPLQCMSKSLISVSFSDLYRCGQVRYEIVKQEGVSSGESSEGWVLQQYMLSYENDPRIEIASRRVG